jgi:hypothetical protein
MDPTIDFLNEEREKTNGRKGMDDICDFFSLATISSYPIDVIKTSIFTETLLFLSSVSLPSP